MSIYMKPKHDKPSPPRQSALNEAEDASDLFELGEALQEQVWGLLDLCAAHGIEVPKELTWEQWEEEDDE